MIRLLKITISVIHVSFGYHSFERPNMTVSGKKATITTTISEKSRYKQTSTKNVSLNKIQTSGKKVTITVSYAAIECGCPQWFESKLKKGKVLEEAEYFYLEPTNKRLKSANGLWDVKNLPLTLKVTGRFSPKKEMPITYYTKGIPERARIFWYDNITIVSQLHSKR